MPGDEDANRTELVPIPAAEGDDRVRISLRTAVQKAEMYVADKLPMYLERLEELAKGVVVMEDRGGEQRVYVTPPDRASLEYLIDRVMGKPPQRYEVTGDEGGPLRFIPWVVLEGDQDIIEGEMRELDGQEG